MMNEKFVFLVEKFFENDLTDLEKKELNNLIESNSELKNEFEEQKRIKEVLNKMKLKNPSREVWDGYWLRVYNRLERGLAWIAISVGTVIFIAFASYEAVNAFIRDTDMPALLKLGIGLMVFGALVLLFSLLREKFFTSKTDKYKEVQR